MSTQVARYVSAFGPERPFALASSKRQPTSLHKHRAGLRPGRVYGVTGPVPPAAGLRCVARYTGAAAMPPQCRWTRHCIETSRRSAARPRTSPRCAALLAGPEAPQPRPGRSPASTLVFVIAGKPQRRDRPRAGARRGEWRRREAQCSGGQSAAGGPARSLYASTRSASARRHRSRPRGASIAAESARSADRRGLSPVGHRPSACTPGWLATLNVRRGLTTNGRSGSKARPREDIR